MGLKNILIFFVPLVIGALFSLFLIPILHNKLGSDFIRTKLILNTLAKGEPAPDILLFGNSILMNGIDANLLMEFEKGALSYNFSSTGQKVMESVLYYPLIHQKTKKVIQFISVDELENYDMLFYDHRLARNFYMYGYRINSTVSELLPDTMLTYFNKHKYKVWSDFRSLIPNYINLSARKFLRKDLSLEKLSTELFYPCTYTKKLDNEKYGRLIQSNNPSQLKTDFAPDVQVVKFLNAIKDYFDKRGIEFYVAIHPINPDLTGYTDAYKAAVNKNILELNEEGLNVISLINSLGSSHFVDYQHPSKEGAIILTQKLASEI